MDDDPQLVLLDLPNDLLLLILAALPHPHTVALTCRRICRLMRSSVRECNILCAWPREQGASLPAFLRSLPQLSQLRLQAVPDWIARNAAALEDLAAARQDTRVHPKITLCLAFCERSFQRMHALGQRAHTSAFALNCDVRGLLQLAGSTKVDLADFVAAREVAWHNAHLAAYLGPCSRSSSLPMQCVAALGPAGALQGLEMAGFKVNDVVVRALASLPHLRHFRSDTPRFNPQLLANLTTLESAILGVNISSDPDLVHGRVRVCGFSRLPGVPALAALQTLVHMRELALVDSVMTWEGLAALGALIKLRRLVLDGIWLTGQEIVEPNLLLTQLETLVICNASFYVYVYRLQVRECIAQLTTLRHPNLCNVNLSRDAARALIALTRLESLNIAKNQLVGNGPSAFYVLTALQSISLADMGTGTATLRALSVLPDFQHLDWTGNELSALGVQTLAGMPSLQHLCLDADLLQQPLLALLASIPHLQRLDIHYFAPSVQGDQPGTGFRCSTTVRFGEGEDLAALVTNATQAVDSPAHHATMGRRRTAWQAGHAVALAGNRLGAAACATPHAASSAQGRLLLGLMGAADAWIYCHVAKGEALCWY